MKKMFLTLTALAAISLLAPNFSYAGAGDDPDPEGHGFMGFYVNDGSGKWVSEAQGVVLGNQKTLYITYLSADIATVRGFEAGIQLSKPTKESQAFSSIITAAFPVQANDLGSSNPSDGWYYYAVGYSSPIVTSQAIVLATLTMFYLEAGNPQVNFDLVIPVPSSHPTSTYPMVIRDDFNLNAVRYITQYADGSFIGPAVIFNGTGVVLDPEETSFGSVKSLFR